MDTEILRDEMSRAHSQATTLRNYILNLKRDVSQVDMVRSLEEISDVIKKLCAGLRDLSSISYEFDEDVSEAQEILTDCESYCDDAFDLLDTCSDYPTCMIGGTNSDTVLSKIRKQLESVFDVIVGATDYILNESYTYDGLFPMFEAKQEDLKAKFGEELFNHYMEIRELLKNTPDKKKYIDFNYLLKDCSVEELSKEVYGFVSNSQIKRNDKLITQVRNMLGEVLFSNFMNSWSLFRGEDFSLKKYKDLNYVLKNCSKKDIEDLLIKYGVSTDELVVKAEDDYTVGGAKKIFEYEDWVLLEIPTYEAAKFYGSGTCWCLSGRYPNFEGDTQGKKWFNIYIEQYKLDTRRPYLYLMSSDKTKPCQKYCFLNTGRQIVEIVHQGNGRGNWNILDFPYKKDREIFYKDKGIQKALDFISNDIGAYVPRERRIEFHWFRGDEIFVEQVLHHGMNAIDDDGRTLCQAYFRDKEISEIALKELDDLVYSMGLGHLKLTETDITSLLEKPSNYRVVLDLCKFMDINCPTPTNQDNLIPFVKSFLETFATMPNEVPNFGRWLGQLCDKLNKEQVESIITHTVSLMSSNDNAFKGKICLDTIRKVLSKHGFKNFKGLSTRTLKILSMKVKSSPKVADLVKSWKIPVVEGYHRGMTYRAFESLCRRAREY